jgi:dipeptidyl aminopeptidase/acylaminoacyl peptidase
MSEDRLRELIRDQRAPDEQAAEERGWRVVRAAFGQRAPAPRSRRLRRAIVALATALALLAAALTPPGQAVADWVRDNVRIGRKEAREALVSLPAPGRVLVASARGPWIVERDGSRRLLGAYEDASWSPRGLYVVGTRGHELVALDPKGQPRWSLARSALVHGPRWSPDGFRIAYLSGHALRVVAGDGTGDRLVASGVADTPPAWRPGSGHQLAFADRDGRVRLVEADSTKLLWRSPPGNVPEQLAWSPDGRRLLALASAELRLFDGRGRLQSAIEMPPGVRAEAAAFARSGNAFALASHAVAAGRSRLTVVRLAKGARRERRLLSGAGRFGDLAWSPDGRWLLAAWRDADQWVFIRTDTDRRSEVEKLRAVSNISGHFDPGGHTRPPFPRLRGWCCPP